MSQETLRGALNQAVAHHQAGRLLQAENIYRQILAQVPTQPDALHLLASIELGRGEAREAQQLLVRAVASAPGISSLWEQLGHAHRACGAPADAESAFRRAIELEPDLASAWVGLGDSLLDQSRLAEAVDALRRAAAMRADLPNAQFTLGTALVMAGRNAEAVEPLVRATEQNPKQAAAFLNLAGALYGLGRIDDSSDALETAVGLAPDAKNLNGLGLIRLQQGRLRDAVACFKRATELDPRDPSIHSNLLLVMNYAEGLSAEEIFKEHLRWAQRHEAPLLKEQRPHGNDRSPERRLRVGYVSSDFKQHPVALAMEPVLENHDRRRVEVYCYSHVNAPDAMTERLEKLSDVWRETSRWSDEQLAGQIRADWIDVLVDLAGHTSRDRLGVFARKPAPVQVTYLGYANTTGMRSMDYVLADRWVAPVGMHEKFFTEKIVRLPRAYLCYVPPAEAPEVSALPANVTGHVTFGCFNRLSKVSDRALEAWMKIVGQVPDSRLVLHADPGRHLESFRSRWASGGLKPEQLEVIERIPLAKYFEFHHRIDITLDPFPHNGGATTRDALWMGVPVVTYAGEFPISRAGLSMLSSIGVAELVASSVEQYVALAVGLANDRPRLAEYRRTLRDLMRGSALMDCAGFAKELEGCYREMWGWWCGGGDERRKLRG